MKKLFTMMSMAAIAAMTMAQSVTTHSVYDVNQNGEINVADAVTVAQAVLREAAPGMTPQYVTAEDLAVLLQGIQDDLTLIKRELGITGGDGDTTPKNKTFSVKGVSFNMKLVKAGTFQMGSNDADARADEQPVHSVTISQDYYMGETEVTQELWKAVTGYSPTSSGSKWASSEGFGNNYPAYNISYDDVQEFITKLNALTGETFRLPTEAEWEYAARGGHKSVEDYAYSGSDAIADVAWYFQNSSSKTHDVKTKAPNELGIYDMTGNVTEWCSDWYGNYSSSPSTDPMGPTSGTYRVCRGGGWMGDSMDSRVTYRYFYARSYSKYDIGFRLALTSSQE